jgi:hypothetical protein
MCRTGWWGLRDGAAALGARLRATACGMGAFVPRASTEPSGYAAGRFLALEVRK